MLKEKDVIKEAIAWIEEQLDLGYLNIGMISDPIEFHIVRMALQEYKKNHGLEEKDA